MKRIILAVIIFSFLFIGIAQAAQFTCNGTASQIYARASYADAQHGSVFIQNQSASVSIYLDTVNTTAIPLTASNGGILLAPGQGIFLENKRDAVFCVTSGSSAIVGLTIFY
jgi:hypothetical protein